MKKILVTLLIFPLLSFAPAWATTIDLTSGSAGNGTINSALFWWYDARSTGTGVIDPFVQIQNNGTEEGYNTSGLLPGPPPAAPLNANKGTWTHDLLLTDVPIVNIGGTDYREFLLDINEAGPDFLLSLDGLKLYLSNTASQTPSDLDLLGTKIYDLDLGADNSIWLLASLNSGSGAGDMLAYIPDSLFVGGNYVYLYSKFGLHNASDDGFEEWAVREAGTPPPAVPEPMTMLLLGTGLVGTGFMVRRRKKNS